MGRPCSFVLLYLRWADLKPVGIHKTKGDSGVKGMGNFGQSVYRLAVKTDQIKCDFLGLIDAHGQDTVLGKIFFHMVQEGAHTVFVCFALRCGDQDFLPSGLRLRGRFYHA